MISIQTLLAPVTAAQARASAVTRLVNLGIPADQWRKGGTYSTILTILTFLFAGFTTVLTSALNAAFLGTATGQWLQNLAFYVYGVTSQQATFGFGPVTLSNTGGGVYSYEPGELVIQDTISGNSFTNAAAISLGAGTPSSPTTQTLNFNAVLSGSVGGCSASAVFQNVTAAPGVQATVTAPILGLDAWTDQQVRAACYAAMAARSQKGPTGAYYAAIYGYANIPGAVNTVSGLPVNINRIKVWTDPDTGAITVYLASPSGLADANDVAGCQVAITAVAQPMGITATAVSCSVVNEAATITIWTTSAGTLAAAAIQANALSAIDAAMLLYPIGGRAKPPSDQGYLFPSYLVAQCNVDPSVYAVDVASWAPISLAVGVVVNFTGTVVVRQTAA